MTIESYFTNSLFEKSSLMIIETYSSMMFFLSLFGWIVNYWIGIISARRESYHIMIISLYFLVDNKIYISYIYRYNGILMSKFEKKILCSMQYAS